MCAILGGPDEQARLPELLAAWQCGHQLRAIAAGDQTRLRAIADVGIALHVEVASGHLAGTGEPELIEQLEERLLLRYAALLVEEVRIRLTSEARSDHAQEASARLLERVADGDLAYFFEADARWEIDRISRERLRRTFHTIVRNLGHDQGRRAGRTSSLDDSPELIPVSNRRAWDPQESAMAGAEAETLNSALCHLDDRDREVLHLRYVEERSPAEVALQLGLSAANVRQIACRRRTELAERMSMTMALRPTGADDPCT